MRRANDFFSIDVMHSINNYYLSIPIHRRLITMFDHEHNISFTASRWFTDVIIEVANCLPTTRCMAFLNTWKQRVLNVRLGKTGGEWNNKTQFKIFQICIMYEYVWQSIFWFTYAKKNFTKKRIVIYHKIINCNKNKKFSLSKSKISKKK